MVSTHANIQYIQYVPNPLVDTRPFQLYSRLRTEKKAEGTFERTRSAQQALGGVTEGGH
jgi:hypothetical protein